MEKSWQIVLPLFYKCPKLLQIWIIPWFIKKIDAVVTSHSNYRWRIIPDWLYCCSGEPTIVLDIRFLLDILILLAYHYKLIGMSRTLLISISCCLWFLSYLFVRKKQNTKSKWGKCSCLVTWRKVSLMLDGICFLKFSSMSRWLYQVHVVYDFISSLSERNKNNRWEKNVFVLLLGDRYHLMVDGIEIATSFFICPNCFLIHVNLLYVSRCK
jgi:hypothetical protein